MIQRGLSGMATGRSGGATKIGGTFLRAAVGPLHYAATCVTGNQIGKGLQELGPDGLGEAYHRGVAEVAKLVGVPKPEVDRVLPIAEATALLERLRTSQASALSAWTMHAGQFGFLDVMTALTVDGRPAEIGLCLERVAGKVRADKALSVPLDSLAADVTAWSDLVVRTRHVLEDRGWLHDAYRRRVILRVVLLAIPLAGLIAFTVGVVVLRLRRDAVDALLAAEDPCALEGTGEEAFRHASDAQRARRAEKLAVCADRREKEAQAQRDAEALAAEERDRAQARARREGACAALAAELEAGELTDASKTVRGDLDELLGRMARKALDPDDIAHDALPFPCGDTPAKARVEAAYGAALLGDVSVWTQRGKPGKVARAALLARKADVPQNALLGLADNAERTAKAGLTGGDPEKIDRAKVLCALARELGIPGRGSCAAIESL